jgi:hypothetical protein
VDENGNTISTWRYSLPQNTIFQLSKLTNLPSDELIWMHCVAYRTENLRKINYHQTEGISYTDQEWIFLPMATCKTLYYYPQVVYKYLVGRNGQTMDPMVFKKNFWQEIRGSVNMALAFGQYNGTTEDNAYTYLSKRLLGRSMVCYGCFLEKYQMGTCYEEMKELDQTLKKVAPSLYKTMADLNRLNPFNSHKDRYFELPRFWVFLVWLWRKRGLPSTLPMVQKLINTKQHIR